MDGTYRWDIFHQKDGMTTVLVNLHLNYDIRYDVEDQIVTKRVHQFHVEQIHPCVSMCRNGKCGQDLCKLTDTDFKSAADSFNPWDYLKDPLLGKLVNITHMGAISFLDQDGGDNQLDLNWRHLRNLAKPIVDEQLSKLAISGEWKNNQVKLHLGTLYVENTIVRIDAASYKEMEKDDMNDDAVDIEACHKSWSKRMAREKMEQEVRDQEHRDYPKRRKTAFATYVNGEEDKENILKDDNKPVKPGTIDTTGEGQGKEEEGHVVRI
jgi:hypothetical protein